MWSQKRGFHWLLCFVEKTENLLLQRCSSLEDSEKKRKGHGRVNLRLHKRQETRSITVWGEYDMDVS